MAQRVECKVYAVLSSYARRHALCAIRLKWGAVALVLIAATGCAYLKRQFRPAELVERLHYGPDAALGELVQLAMSQGYWTVNGEGQARQVLELNKSDSGSVHRQFFQVQPLGEGLAKVFFLENKGSLEETKIRRFPAQVRADLKEFLGAITGPRRDCYQPLMVRQEKLSRKMILYEDSAQNATIEFTKNVVALERSNLYGLLHVPDGTFMFFGKKSQKPFRRDFLDADNRFSELIQEFINVFQVKTAL